MGKEGAARESDVCMRMCLVRTVCLCLCAFVRAYTRVACREEKLSGGNSARCRRVDERLRCRELAAEKERRRREDGCEGVRWVGVEGASQLCDGQWHAASVGLHELHAARPAAADSLLWALGLPDGVGVTGVQGAA